MVIGCQDLLYSHLFHLASGFYAKIQLHGGHVLILAVYSIVRTTWAIIIPTVVWRSIGRTLAERDRRLSAGGRE